MNQLNLRQAFELAHQTLRQYKKAIIIATLLFLLAEIAVMLPAYTLDTPIKRASVPASVVNLITNILSEYFLLGFTCLCLDVYRGKSIQIKTLFMQPVSRWLNRVITNIICSFAVFLGLVLLILPGIYIFTRLHFAPLIVADKDMSASEAIKESCRLTRNQALPTFSLILGLGGLLLGGLILCGVGFLYTAPLAMLFHIAAYLQLTSPETQKREISS